MITLTDTHCHLSLDQFSDELEPILERANEAGVGHLLIPGIDMETSRRAVELAENHDQIFCRSWGSSAQRIKLFGIGSESAHRVGALPERCCHWRDRVGFLS